MMNKKEMYELLKDCERCKVYGTNDTPLTYARVQTTRNDILLYFKSPYLKDARVKLKIDFYDDRSGIMRCLCELVIYRNPDFPKIPELWMADFRVLDIFKRVQRQKDVRVKVYLEAEFYTEGRRLFFGTVQNLSAGGLYLRAQQRLKDRERIIFKWREGRIEKDIRCVVTRREAPFKGLYGYGCQFLDLPKEVDEDLRHYVYEKRKERKQKRREAESGYDRKK